jgi:hypothetical protein
MGTGSLLTLASHALQVGPENVGLGPLKPDFYYGMGVIVSKGRVATSPQLVGYAGTVGYFPAKKIAVVCFRRSDAAASHLLPTAPRRFCELRAS